MPQQSLRLIQIDAWLPEPATPEEMLMMTHAENTATAVNRQFL